MTLRETGETTSRNTPGLSRGCFIEVSEPQNSSGDRERGHGSSCRACGNQTAYRVLKSHSWQIVIMLFRLEISFIEVTSSEPNEKG